MLEDQKFEAKPVIALGPEFFLPDDVGVPDYTFCMGFRAQERLSELWDFHYVALATQRNAEILDHLQALGVSIQLGELFPEKPTKDTYRKTQSLFVSIDMIHSKAFTEVYRLTGRKNYSTIPAHVFFMSLVDASFDPSPDAFRQALIRNSP